MEHLSTSSEDEREPVNLHFSSGPVSESSDVSLYAIAGRRRLCKVRPSEPQKDFPADDLYDDLEDWHEEGASDRPLAANLDELSISTDSSKESSDVFKASTLNPRAKIMDSLTVLKEAKNLSATESGNLHAIAEDGGVILDVKKASNIPDVHGIKQKNHNDMGLLNKSTLIPKISGLFASKSIWDIEDEKENSVGEVLTFVHNNLMFRLPQKLAHILYPHQFEGIKWLWGLHVKRMGGILGDDMGLGKTMQIATFLVGLFASNLIKNALVVAPKTLIAHWTKELSFVGLSRKTKDYSGPSASQRQYALQHVLQLGGILLTTYDVVRNNWQALRGDFHGRDGYGDTSDDIITWDYMVLDEGHLIKNPSTQRAKSLKEIPCAHRIVLTGTPIQNNLRELWALFDFCYPNLLGDRKEFKAKYENLISSANSKDSTDRQKRAGSAVAQDLRKRIAPFFLRRLKSEVFPNVIEGSNCKLSTKTDIIVWLRLTVRQRELYTAFLESETAHQSLEGSALAALTVLKKICDHPSLLTQRAADDIAEGMESLLNAQDAAKIDSIGASITKLLKEGEDCTELQETLSCKIAFIMVLLDRLVDDGHRVLVFSQTRKMLDIIQREITKRQYQYLRIDGTVKASEREKYVQEFQKSSSIPIFLLTSKVGGLGLTLTAANRVIIVDPAWNPSTDNQSVDRAYRIGQKQDVIIYRLMTSGTIEEKIYRKQVFKGGLFKVATEHKEQYRYFSHQELQELFTLPKTGFDISVTQQQLHEEHNKQYQRDKQLEDHINFLESQNIAGVSHHDLLFSKQAPEMVAVENETWNLQHWRDGPSGPRQDILSLPPQDWAKKTVPKPKFEEAPLNIQRLEVSTQISRLSVTLSDMALVSRLPDKGSNLKMKLEDLKNQMKNLSSIGEVKKNEPIALKTVSVKEEVLELDEVSNALAGLKV